MSSPFDATGSLLGYLYQCRLALVDALALYRRGRQFAMSIETLDDVVFESSGSPMELLQTKHSIRRTAHLTDTSADLWKTLRVWSEGISSGRWLDDTYHRLVTTATAADDSIASLLRPGPTRNTPRALELLVDQASSGLPLSNIAFYRAFLALDDEERGRLVAQITILDKAPQIQDLSSVMRDACHPVVRQDLLASFIVRLEGWWWQRLIVHLTAVDKTPILSEEIDAQFERLRRELRDDNLPIDQEIVDAPVDPTVLGNHVFVEQLRFIAITQERLAIAMREYYRASTQRSRWLREGLVVAGELERYDRRLREAWETRFLAMRDSLGEAPATSDKRARAQALYAWAEQDALVHIRPACTEPFVTKGSLQILSDRVAIGWHPDFRERFADLLEEGVQ
jgi:hypothetical protein